MSHFYKAVNDYYNVHKPIATKQVDYKVNQDIALFLHWNWYQLKYSLLLYIKGLSTHVYPTYLNIFLYIIVHYRLVVYSLNNLIGFYIARMPYYRGVVYEFKYLKS